MKITYFECFAGIASDTLLDAHVSAWGTRSVLEDATAALRQGNSLRFETVDRSGISATKSRVPVDTPFGHIHLRVGPVGREVPNVGPEYEDYRRAAEGRHIPLKEIQAAALMASMRRDGTPADSHSGERIPARASAEDLEMPIHES